MKSVCGNWEQLWAAVCDRMASWAWMISKEGTSTSSEGTFQSGKEASQRQTRGRGCAWEPYFLRWYAGECTHLARLTVIFSVSSCVHPCVCVYYPCKEGHIPGSVDFLHQGNCHPLLDRLFSPVLYKPWGFHTYIDCVSGILAYEKPPNFHSLYCGHPVALVSGGSYFEHPVLVALLPEGRLWRPGCVARGSVDSWSRGRVIQWYRADVDSQGLFKLLSILLTPPGESLILMTVIPPTLAYLLLFLRERADC